MLKQLRAHRRLGLPALVLLLILGCNAAPMFIEREAQVAVVTNHQWHQKATDSKEVVETRTLMGREVTVRAISHVGLWTFDSKAAVAVVTTPQLEVFGVDANPAANLTDEQLVHFILDAARSQTSQVPGLQFPKNITLHKVQDHVVQAAIGSMKGSQFRADSEGVAATVLILRVKSGSDHVVLLGLIPNPVAKTSFDALIEAVIAIKHPG